MGPVELVETIAERRTRLAQEKPPKARRKERHLEERPWTVWTPTAQDRARARAIESGSPFTIADAIRADLAAGDAGYRAAGEKFAAQKAALPHGEWLPWLAANGFQERTAQRYMAFAKSAPGVGYEQWRDQVDTAKDSTAGTMAGPIDATKARNLGDEFLRKLREEHPLEGSPPPRASAAAAARPAARPRQPKTVELTWDGAIAGMEQGLDYIEQGLNYIDAMPALTEDQAETLRQLLARIEWRVSGSVYCLDDET